MKMLTALKKVFYNYRLHEIYLKKSSKTDISSNDVETKKSDK